MKNFKVISIITLITLVLFIIPAYFLLENDVISFKWYDKFQQEKEVNQALLSDYKVLILGDSQLDKWPLEHSLDKDLREYFKSRGMGCINAAHYGFSPIEYAHELRNVLPKYKPDHIFLFFYAGNDLTDVIYRDSLVPKKRIHRIFEEELDSIERKDDNSNKESAEFDWNAMKEGGVDTTLIRYAKNASKTSTKFGNEYVNPHLLNTGIWKPDFHYDNLTLNKLESKYAWYKAIQYLDQIRDLADSIDARLNIIVIPSNVQVDTLNYQFYRRAKYVMGKDLLYVRAPQYILYSYTYNYNIGYLDLLPYFLTDSNRSEIYLVNDNHLSSRGHELAFGVVKDEILEKISGVKSKVSYVDKGKREFDFSSYLVQREMEIIESDSVWFEDIKKKAQENAISVDSQLKLDALYMVDVVGDLK